MSITVEAIYEDGVLKPNEPLPLKECQMVRITIQSDDSGFGRWQTLIPCQDAELIEQAALDPELEF